MLDPIRKRTNRRRNFQILLEKEHSEPVRERTHIGSTEERILESYWIKNSTDSTGERVYPRRERTHRSYRRKTSQMRLEKELSDPTSYRLKGGSYWRKDIQIL